MSTTTSDTPRTDECAFRWASDEPQAVPADFARELERELSQANAQLHALRLVCGTTDANKFQTVVDRQLAELEVLRKDKARMDWLESQGVVNCGWIARKSTTGRGYRLHQGYSAPHRQTPRQAIDAAMEESK